MLLLQRCCAATQPPRALDGGFMSARRFLRCCLGITLTVSAAACTDRALPAGAALPAQSALTRADAFDALPLLGWNSFDVMSSKHPGYGQTWLNEFNVKNASDALQQRLQSAGYQYINIDSGWSATYSWTSYGYDAYGVPLPNPERFPSGIDGMAAYVHAKGQKLGLYDGVGIEVNVYNGNYPIEGTNCHTQEIA